ncbi:hypothetical protein Lser_V15G14978 [Lactuca serriola]
MTLNGTLVKETTIKSDGDAFLELFCYKPYEISDMCPPSIQSCDILDGKWGSLGSVIIWKYSHNGSDCTAKEVIEENDTEKKLVCFKVVDGTLMDYYKSFFLTIHVDTKGEKHSVTWKLDYEKLNENVEDPKTLMDFCLNVTKDIDNHRHKHFNESEMNLSGNLVKEIVIKSDGDAFLELFCYKPYDISNMCRSSIQGCDILDGEWGSVGSVIIWKYHHDGMDCTAKEVIEVNDREKKLVCFKVVDGTLMDYYKSLLLTIHVDTKGEKHIVTWNLAYEKLNENVEDPKSLMEFCLNVTKDIDNSQHKHFNESEMNLSGNLVNETTIESDGDAFLELFCYKPYAILNMCPNSIQGCDILDGEWGSVGSVIIWKYHHDGRDCMAKEVIEANNKEEKLVCFKVVDGTLMDYYKNFFLTIHVDTKGSKHLVTWTLAYEKLNENIEDPKTLMEFCLKVTKDIDTHQHKHNN